MDGHYINNCQGEMMVCRRETWEEMIGLYYVPVMSMRPGGAELVIWRINDVGENHI
jgi:hypothetical protein